MDMDQMTDEERRKLAETRERISKQNAQRLAEWFEYLDQNRKEALELMRNRHAYYTKLITDAGIKTAQDFYDRFKEQFLMYGIELTLSDNKEWCSIYLELGDYDYESYSIGDAGMVAWLKLVPKLPSKIHLTTSKSIYLQKKNFKNDLQGLFY